MKVIQIAIPPAIEEEVKVEKVGLPENFLVTYTGTIGDDFPIRMILEREGKYLYGNYYYEKFKKMLFLQGSIDSNGKFELIEIPENLIRGFYGIDEKTHLNVPETGIIRGTIDVNLNIMGVWSNRIQVNTQNNDIKITPVDGDQKLPLQLTQENKDVLDPEQIFDRLDSFEESVELCFFLFEYITGVNWQISHYGTYAPSAQSMYTEWLPINTSFMQKELYFENFWGSDDKEALLVLSFNEWLYVLTPFIKTGHSWKWKPIPSMIINRPAYRIRPCAADTPGEGYFYYSLQEAKSRGQFVLEGRIYGGDCDVSPRGNEITYHIWEMNADGWREIFQEVEDSYWYNNPLPKPIEKPISLEFQIVPGEQSTFPKRLKRTENIIEVITRKDGLEVPITTGKNVTYLNIFE